MPNQVFFRRIAIIWWKLYAHLPASGFVIHVWAVVRWRFKWFRCAKVPRRDFLFLMGIKVEPVELNLVHRWHNSFRCGETSSLKGFDSGRTTDTAFHSNGETSAERARPLLLLSFESKCEPKKGQPTIWCRQCRHWIATDIATALAINLCTFHSFLSIFIDESNTPQPLLLNSLSHTYVEVLFYWKLKFLLVDRYPTEYRQTVNNGAWTHWINAEFFLLSRHGCDVVHIDLVMNLYPYQVA